jgi:DNA-binding SARP family transcriptional activator/DNA-binding transcriptional ArsR family regulator
LEVLYIHLLGEFNLLYGDQPVTTVNTTRLQLLLAYLVLHRARHHRRSVLAGLLDPDAPEPRARHALSQAIWQLRRSLPDLIESDRDLVGLSPHAALWVDALEFERLAALHLQETAGAFTSAACTDLRQAVLLYRGDLLEGLYDDWLLVERERLHEVYLQALESLAQLEKSAGRYRAALDAALTLALADPLRGSAQRQVMQLYFCLGRPEAALQQFETYRQTLSAELDVEPEPETLALAQAIAGRTAGVIAHLPDALTGVSFLLNRTDAIPLVGRSRERAEMLSHLEGAFAGVGGVVLVEGEAGIGKTRLLQELGRDAEWRGAQVLWAKAEEQAGPAYGLLLRALSDGLSPLRADQIAHLVETIWLQVLCPLLSTLAARLPALPPPAPLDPAQEQARLTEAIARLLAAWAQIMPVVLILEDLHWALPDTLDVLTAVARQIHSVGVLIVGSYRGDEARARPGVWNKLQALDRDGACARLALARLDAAATGELIRRALGWGKPAPLFENRLYAETAGTPLFVLETLRALYDKGLLQRDERGEWSITFDESTTDYAELPLSPIIEHVIALRVAQLSREPRAALNAAAVLGRRFDFALLDALGELETSALLAAIGVLVQRGLLIESPQDYAFGHDKVRQIVYASMAPDERIRLHRRAAQAVEAQHPDWQPALAHHWTQAQVWDKAIHCRRLAAEEASVRHAYATAVEHLNAALVLADAASLAPSARFDLLAAREAAFDVLGDRDAQASDLAAMLPLARDDAPRQMLAQQRRAVLLSHLSRFDDAQSAAREALALAEQLDDTAGQATALTALGTALNWRGQTAQALPFLRQAVAVCSAGAEPRLEAQAHHALGDALIGVTEYPTARAEVQSALACYERLNDPAGHAEALGLLAIIQMEQGDLAPAGENYRRAIEICRAIGYRYGEARNLLNYGNVFYAQNQISEALRCYDEAAAVFRAIGHPRGEASVRANMASLYHEVLGDDVTATAHAESALAYFRQAQDPIGTAQCLGILGEIAQCRGDGETARALLEEGVSIALEAGERWIAVQAIAGLAEALLDQRRPESALERLDTADAICRELGFKDLAANLQASRGLAFLALEQPEAALAATAEAMAQLGPGVEMAHRIPFAHYQALATLGRVDEARAALEQARQLLTRLLDGLSPEQRAMSMERVPEHRAILAAWQAAQPRRVTTRLARTGAPAGRPLRADERIEVTWTLAAPEDEAIRGKAARRRHRLLRLLREAEEQGAAPTVNDLADALDASRVTIKRDLAALRQAGQSARTRGGRKSAGEK